MVHHHNRGRQQPRSRGWPGLLFAMEAIFFALLAVTGISSCPRKCQCIWRDSKITVDCSDQELAAIPTTVEPNTQVSISLRNAFLGLKEMRVRKCVLPNDKPLSTQKILLGQLLKAFEGSKWGTDLILERGSLLPLEGAFFCNTLRHLRSKLLL